MGNQVETVKVIRVVLVLMIIMLQLEQVLQEMLTALRIEDLYLTHILILLNHSIMPEQIYR